jgi:hypothetical protein
VAISGGRPPWNPALDCTTKSPTKPLFTVPRMESVAEDQKMRMKATSPTPIISAAAVEAVRLGLRMAFSRASTPAMPRSLAMGQPITRATGRAITGPSTATPRNVNTAPPPTTASALSGLANRPMKSCSKPRAKTSPPSARRTIDRPDSSTLIDRMAATGGTFDALRAGKKAEATVMTTPTRMGTTMALASMVRPLAGMSIPRAPSRPLRRIATPKPTTTPTTEAIRPVRNASTSTELSTCRREAPMARNSAISRLRWATMIENVL